MEIGRQLRKLLILCEESSARDTMRVLLGSMGCECVVASTVQQAIAVLEQENPDAAIVDPRSSGFSAASIVSEFDKLHPSLRDRVVVLSGNESEPEIEDLLRRYSLRRVSRDRLLQELWGSLESLLHPNKILRRVVDAAQLVFDSFLQPIPAGVRGTRLPDRRLVYQSEVSWRISGLSRRAIRSTSRWLARLWTPPDSIVSSIRFQLSSAGARAPSPWQRPTSSANFTLTSSSSPASVWKSISADVGNGRVDLYQAVSALRQSLYSH